MSGVDDNPIVDLYANDDEPDVDGVAQQRDEDDEEDADDDMAERPQEIRDHEVAPLGQDAHDETDGKQDVTAEDGNHDGTDFGIIQVDGQGVQIILILIVLGLLELLDVSVRAQEEINEDQEEQDVYDQGQGGHEQGFCFELQATTQ